ncbi:hypothetical protein SCALM49S_03133 [Streptomyces californicus]
MAAERPTDRDVSPAASLTASLADERVDHRFKALPPDAQGLTVGALAAERRNLFTGGFTTPVLALSAESVAHNLDLLETYAERHGLAFAPHGKTSMSPQLFAGQLERGAWGITAAGAGTRPGSTGRTGSAGSSSPTSWSTRSPCAGWPARWRPTRRSASSATSTRCAASS